MPLYLSRPGGKMKGMSVLRSLGKRLAQSPVSENGREGTKRANTLHTVIDFSVTEQCQTAK